MPHVAIWPAYLFLVTLLYFCSNELEIILNPNYQSVNQVTKYCEMCHLRVCMRRQLLDLLMVYFLFLVPAIIFFATLQGATKSVISLKPLGWKFLFFLLLWVTKLVSDIYEFLIHFEIQCSQNIPVIFLRVIQFCFCFHRWSTQGINPL